VLPDRRVREVDVVEDGARQVDVGEAGLRQIDIVEGGAGEIDVIDGESRLRLLCHAHRLPVTVSGRFPGRS
jgi:hypothetical protein